MSTTVKNKPVVAKSESPSRTQVTPPPEVKAQTVAPSPPLLVQADIYQVKPTASSSTKESQPSSFDPFGAWFKTVQKWGGTFREAGNVGSRWGSATTELRRAIKDGKVEAKTVRTVSSAVRSTSRTVEEGLSFSKSVSEAYFIYSATKDKLGMQGAATLASLIANGSSRGAALTQLQKMKGLPVSGQALEAMVDEGFAAQVRAKSGKVANLHQDLEPVLQGLTAVSNISTSAASLAQDLRGENGAFRQLATSVQQDFADRTFRPQTLMQLGHIVQSGATGMADLLSFAADTQKAIRVFQAASQNGNYGTAARTSWRILQGKTAAEVEALATKGRTGEGEAEARQAAKQGLLANRQDNKSYLAKLREQAVPALRDAATVGQGLITTASFAQGVVQVKQSWVTSFTHLRNDLRQGKLETETITSLANSFSSSAATLSTGLELTTTVHRGLRVFQGTLNAGGSLSTAATTTFKSLLGKTRTQIVKCAQERVQGTGAQAQLQAVKAGLSAGKQGDTKAVKYLTQTVVPALKTFASVARFGADVVQTVKGVEQMVPQWKEAFTLARKDLKEGKLNLQTIEKVGGALAHTARTAVSGIRSAQAVDKVVRVGVAAIQAGGLTQGIKATIKVLGGSGPAIGKAAAKVVGGTGAKALGRATTAGVTVAGKVATGTFSKVATKLVPGLNAVAAAADVVTAVKTLRDPNAKVSHKVCDCVTAVASVVGACNIPVVSQVASVVSIGSSLVRNFF